jgi:hypothetical protein
MNKIGIRMKKAPLLTILATILFVLTACGSGSASTNSAGSGTASTNSFRSGAASTPLNTESKLALGTIKLENTKLAVDPKMAANLIPLWQLLFQLNSSSSSAPQEVTAVVDQIHATMTPEQINTINSMTLTQADIFSVFQQQGQANGSGTTGSGSAGPGGGNRGGGFVFAGGPGGGGPGGGGFGGGFSAGGAAGGASTTTQATALTAAQAAQARQNAISGLLINQVIRLLQTKISS